MQIQTARNAGKAACLVQPLKGISEPFTFFFKKNTAKPCRYPGYKKSEGKKYLNSLIAEVTKNAHKSQSRCEVCPTAVGVKDEA